MADRFATLLEEPGANRFTGLVEKPEPETREVFPEKPAPVAGRGLYLELYPSLTGQIKVESIVDPSHTGLGAAIDTYGDDAGSVRAKIANSLIFAEHFEMPFKQAYKMHDSLARSLWEIEEPTPQAVSKQIIKSHQSQYAPPSLVAGKESGFLSRVFDRYIRSPFYDRTGLWGYEKVEPWQRGPFTALALGREEWPEFEDLKRKAYWQAVKDAWRQAGVRMTKGIAGRAQMTGDIVGFVRLAQWGQMMAAACDLYYEEHPDEQMNISPGTGFVGTTVQYIAHPENLLQATIETGPMLLGALAGHITGTVIAEKIGWGFKFLPWAGRVSGIAEPIVGEVYAEARAQGTPPHKALPQAYLTGYLEGAIEEWTIAQKVKIFKGVAGSTARQQIAKTATDILLAGGKAYTRGVGEEYSQEVNRNFWQMVFTDPEPLLENFRARLTANAAEAAAAGGLIEMGLSGGFAIAGKGVNAAQKKQRIENIRQQTNKNDSLLEQDKVEINAVLDQESAKVEQEIKTEKPPKVVEKAPVTPIEVKPPTEPTQVTPEAKPAKPAIEFKDADKYRSHLVGKWGEEKFDKMLYDLAESGRDEQFSVLDETISELDEQGKWDSPEAHKLRIQLDSIVDRELEAAEKKVAEVPAKGLFGQPIFEPITGEQLEFDIGEIEKTPSTLREVEIKPELAQFVGKVLSEADAPADPKALYLNRLTQPERQGLFIHPKNPMPEVMTAWNEAVLGKTFLIKTTPEIGLKEAAVIETGISDKQRSRLIKKIEQAIKETDAYKIELEGLEREAAKIPVGTYFVQQQYKGEVKAAIENYPSLRYHITYDPQKGKHWDEALMEAKEGGRDIDYFLEQLGQSLESRKTTKEGLNVIAFEKALERGNPEVQILEDIRYGLKSGKPIREINANTMVWAKHYDLTRDDVADILVKELSDEEIRAEQEKARAEDKALEELEAERLREKKEKTAVEQKRLKEIIAKQEALTAKQKAKEQQTKKLRHDIHAVAAKKGLTKKALSDLKLKHTGYRHLTGKIAQKKIKTEQLQSLLKAVHKTRPKRIGYRQVITKKTETKIQSLKESLTTKTAMTDANFAEILQKEVHGKEPKYIDARRFITETEGKSIIRRMLDEAEVIRVTEGYERAIRENDEIHNQVKILDQRIKGRPKRDPWSLESMRYYNQQAEIKTGAPFYAMYMDLLDTHLDDNKTRRATWTKLENTIGKEQFRLIGGDRNALKRVSDYIAAQSTLREKPASPKDITDNEVKLAKQIQAILKEYEIKVRAAKFFNFYYYNQPIAEYDRFKREINKAVDVYESKGKEELIEYLKTQEWGVIRSGYEPLEVLRPKVQHHDTGPTAAGRGHIKIRTDLEYHTQERNILQRLSSYMRQIDMFYSMSPKVNAFVRLFDDNMSKFKDPSVVKENIETFLRNLKRHNIQGGFFEKHLARLYAQAMRVIIMPSPVLSFRNLFQNAAFEHDKSILIDPRNKPLSNERVEFLETYVLQTRAMVEEYFMVGEKPYVGLRFLSGLIDKVRLYPHSDITNRHWGFWGKINQVDRALEVGAIAEMMKEASFEDITELEQRRALGILAKDGKEAMARYVARVHVDDVHFLYERAQRSPAEQTSLGKVVGNLLLFPRAYGEKLTHAANKMLRGKTSQEQWRGLKILFAVIAGGMVCGSIYRKITGRKRNPYDPLEVLAYEAGGLAWGAVEAANKVAANILLAVSGDKRALAALTTDIPRAADMFIPFYDYTLRGYEALTDQKNVDRKALRQIRTLIDKEYKIRGGAYKVRRTALEKWQYFIAGAGVDQKEKKVQPVSKIERK